MMKMAELPKEFNKDIKISIGMFGFMLFIVVSVVSGYYFIHDMQGQLQRQNLRQQEQILELKDRLDELETEFDLSEKEIHRREAIIEFFERRLEKLEDEENN